MTARIPVAVTMRLAPAVGYAEPRDAVSHDLTRLLFELGLVPILVPNTTPDPAEFVAATGARAVLFSGGDDLGSEPRDGLELRLLAAAIERDLPVLGVCRGLQLLNVAFGGSVTPDLASAVPGEAHVATSHLIELADERTFSVNSFHRSGVLVGQLAPSLRIVAATRGGVVEAFEHRDHAITAIQWHPERPGSAGALDRAILEGWVGRCA
jgi:gamma-glutamyl-gamma-aminobutyrate hydrolase PuuD